MKSENAWDETSAVDDLPVSSTVVVLRPSKYGSIADLPEEELADPEELEQQVMAQAWAPILALGVKGRRESFRPSVDESGRVEGAFASMDFHRIEPEFDRVRYKAQKLKEQLSDLLIMISIVKERLPGNAKYLVLKYLRMGWIEMEDLVNEDMLALARLELRARRLQQDIAKLEEGSRARRRQRLAPLLEP